MCQCPLGLIPHCYDELARAFVETFEFRVNALSGLYLIVTYFSNCGGLNVIFVSMPSRAYTSLLRGAQFNCAHA